MLTQDQVALMAEDNPFKLMIALSPLVEPVTITLREKPPPRENPLQHAFDLERSFVPRRPMGFVRPYKKKEDYNDTDREDEQRCNTTYRLFDERIGRAYHMSDPEPLSAEEFRKAWWEIVKEGRTEAAGTQSRCVPGVALDYNPPAFSGRNAKQLFSYQKQDVGAAYQILAKHNSTLLAHAMGMGKTIQSLALVEHKRKTQGPILVILPLSLIPQWIVDMESMMPDRRLYDYRDQRKRRLSPKEISEYNYVVTTYDMVAKEYRQATTFAYHQTLRTQGISYDTIEPSDQAIMRAYALKRPEPKTRRIPLVRPLLKTALHSVWFDTIICDEAHKAKGNGIYTESLCALLRKRTVLMTGTPQHNDYFDLFALFRLLSIAPFANDEHSFKQYFVNKENKSEWAALSADRLRMLALTLRAFSLRRLPTSVFEGKPVVDLPKHVDHDTVRVSPDNGIKYPHHIAMGCGSEIEAQDESKHLWSQFQRSTGEDGITTWKKKKKQSLGDHDSEEHKMKDHAFRLILRSRQAAAHPAVTLTTQEPVSEHQEQDSNSKPEKKVMSDKAWRELVEQGDNYRSSTIDAALDIMEEHLNDMAKDPRERGGILVFTEFHRVIDILEIAIRKRLGRGCLRRTGKSGGAEKQDTIRNFKAHETSGDRDHVILIMTPASGGEGLNLPEASTVITLTPALNPFRDQQARSRPFRIGQKRVVHLYYFVMAGSYEDRSEFICDRKLHNAKGVTEWDQIEQEALAQAQNWTEEDFYAQVSHDSALTKHLSQLTLCCVD